MACIGLISCENYVVRLIVEVPRNVLAYGIVDVAGPVRVRELLQKLDTSLPVAGDIADPEQPGPSTLNELLHLLLRDNSRIPRFPVDIVEDNGDVGQVFLVENRLV